MTATEKTEAQVIAKPNGHSDGDVRYAALERTMKRFKYEKDALLEVLNSAQEVFGYLSEELLIYISNQLGVPLSQVYGVATFYHLFTFAPLGDHHCVVCAGTACHVKGSAGIVSSLSSAFDIQPGDTTPDGSFSLTIARCLGSCGLAPLIVLDGAVIGKSTPESAMEQVTTILAAASQAAE